MIMMLVIGNLMKFLILWHAISHLFSDHEQALYILQFFSSDSWTPDIIPQFAALSMNDSFDQCWKFGWTEVLPFYPKLVQILLAMGSFVDSNADLPHIYLHVPSLDKNLIFVHRFVQDDDCFIGFHAWGSWSMDSKTKWFFLVGLHSFIWLCFFFKGFFHFFITSCHVSNSCSRHFHASLSTSKHCSTNNINP